MHNPKVMYEEPAWERFERKVKMVTYSMMHELLQAKICSPFFFKLLIIIETVHLLYFSIHPILDDFLWNSTVLSYIRDAIKYFQFNYIINDSQSGLSLGLLYFVFAIVVILVALVAISTWRISTNSGKSTSTFLAYSIKILSVFALILTTVGVLPFFNAFIAIIFCDKNASASAGFDCYQGIYMLHLGIAVVGAAVLITFSLTFTLLYIDLNPSSTIPFSRPQSRINIYRWIMKMIIITYVTIDYKGKFGEQYVTVLLLMYLLLLFMRYRATPYYNREIQVFMLASEASLLWVTFCVVVQAFLSFDDNNPLVLFFVFFCIPFFAYAFIKLLDARKWTMMKKELKALKKDEDVEMYIAVMMELIEKRERTEPRIKLEGLIKLHLKHCVKAREVCPCSVLAADNMKEEETPEKTLLWYGVVRSIIGDCIDRFPKSSRLHLLHSYIHNEKLKNKFKALYELMNASECKPTLAEDFSAYRFLKLIEEEMVENDMRNSETKGIDVNMIVTFQNRFVDFQAAIHSSVVLHLEFWRELLEESPDIFKLQGLGSRITNTVEATSDHFNRLNEINTNNIRCLELYGYFLRDIVNDDADGQRILEKADYVAKSTMVNKQFVDNERVKYGENSNTCIVTCSGNSISLGTVVNVNNELTRILDYVKTDLINQNISKIMPKVFANLHDGFMRNFFEKSKGRVMGAERMVFPANKAGYLVPCTLMIKVLPNLDEGIRVVGFLKEVESGSSMMKADFDSDEKVHYLIFESGTGNIHGISHSVNEAFGIPSALCYGNKANTAEFTIEAIAPELGNTKNYEELRTQGGCILTLDTSTLQSNFLLVNDESEFAEEPEGQDEVAADRSKHSSHYQRFRRAKIRAVLAEEETYGEHELKIIRFVEVDENEEVGKAKVVIGTTPATGTSGKEGTQVELSKAKGADDKAAREEVERVAMEDVDKSDHESNFSGHSMADEMRKLKDFKAMISEKTVPKSIKCLKRTVFCLFAGLAALASIKLSYRFAQNDQALEGLNAVYSSTTRHSIMADINLNTRLLDLLRTDSRLVYLGGATPTTKATDLNALLTAEIDILQANQFEVIKASIQMQNRMGSEPPPQYYNIAFMLQNGEIKVYSNLFNDALFQFVTFTSSIRNSSIFSNTTADTEAVYKNFYFVETNGLQDIRAGSEQISQDFYQFYIGATGDLLTQFEIFLIAEVAFMVMSQLVLIPIVFSVHKTNNKVLSLFGYIPKPEIEELVDKCENYLVKYLEDQIEHGDHSFNKSEDNVKEEQQNKMNASYMEVANFDESQENQPENVQISVLSESGQIQEKLKSLSGNGVAASQPSDNLSPNSKVKNTLSAPKPNDKSPTSTPEPLIKPMPVNGSMSPSKKIDEKQANPIKKLGSLTRKKTKMMDKGDVAKSKQTDKVIDRKKSEKGAEADEEEENERTKKLLNSKDNNRNSILLQFSALTILFVAFFVGHFFFEWTHLDNVKQCYFHLSLIAERPGILKYGVVFSNENIATSKPLIYKGANLQELYSNLIYDNERSILSNGKKSFPAQFNDFLDQYNQLTSKNLCENYYNGKDAKSVACIQIGGGLLAKGLSQAVTSITEYCRDGIIKFNGTSKARQDQINYFQSTLQIQTMQLLNYSVPALDYLVTLYNQNFNDYLDFRLLIAKIVFTLYIISVVVIFLVIWGPYLGSLSSKIWRTKGMLNMIPMELITKNETLKVKFLTGDLLQAVR